jgi:cyclopropane fatty-acyl-phospholipid synthase-like methyltransferase
MPVHRVHRHNLSRRDSQNRNIGHHYDIGNDYYKLFLDPTMTYSCAYFTSPDDSLEDAQHHKIDYLLRKLRIQPGQRILDVGSGWGSLAVAAARDYDAVVLGVTLSEEQLAGALALRYRLGNCDGRFDRVLSVGMFEHVGRGQQHSYFQVVREMLAPGGGQLAAAADEGVRRFVRLEAGADGLLDRVVGPTGRLAMVGEHVGFKNSVLACELWVCASCGWFVFVDESVEDLSALAPPRRSFSHSQLTRSGRVRPTAGDTRCTQARVSAKV